MRNIPRSYCALTNYSEFVQGKRFTFRRKYDTMIISAEKRKQQKIYAAVVE